MLVLALTLALMLMLTLVLTLVLHRVSPVGRLRDGADCAAGDCAAPAMVLRHSLPQPQLLPTSHLQVTMQTQALMQTQVRKRLEEGAPRLVAAWIAGGANHGAASQRTALLLLLELPEVRA